VKGVGPLVVTEAGRNLRVRGRGAGDFLRDYCGFKAMFVRGAFVIDATHGPDLAAMCDYRNVKYRWEAAA